MKKISTILLLFLTLTSIGQTCESALVSHEGALMEYTMYDAKGKFDGKSTHLVKNVDSEGDVTSAEIHLSLVDEKNKEVLNSDYGVSCESGLLKVDVSQMAGAMQAESAKKDIELEIEGIAIEYPEDMEVGSTLPDATMTITMINNGVEAMTIPVQIKDRKVVAEESITTEAGTFDCKKLTYTTEMSMGPITIKTSTAEWFSSQEMIMAEYYNKKGKLQSSQKLTKIVR